MLVPWSMCSPVTSRRLDDDRISATGSSHVRNVATATRSRSAAREASSTQDGAAAEEATEAVLQLQQR